MDSSLILAAAILVCIPILANTYKSTELARVKAESEASVQKAEIYRDRHVTQARIEAQAWNQGFNDEFVQAVPASGIDELKPLLDLMKLPEAQNLLNSFIKK